MFSGMHKLLCKNLLTGKLIRNHLQRLSLHSSCPFHAIYINSCKKHIHSNVICLHPTARLLAVGSFVSPTESEFAFQYLPNPFLVFII